MKDFFKYSLFAFGGAIVVATLFGLFSLLTLPGRTVMGVAEKTFHADNVLTRYEQFFDINAVYTSRVNQISSSKKMFATEQDQGEKQRLRMEMAAQQQSCRDLATKYNANASKLNVYFFRDKNLPESLSINACE